MFTAEELENCDILPKKLTWSTALKCLFYFGIMISISILLYSFYSGKDFKSIVTMENMKYSTDDYFTSRLFILDKSTNYDLGNKYHRNYTELTRVMFIKEYVNQNLPCIIKNSTNTLPVMQNLSDAYLDERFQGIQLRVEERNEPLTNFMSSDFRSYQFSYGLFKQKATDNSRLVNYFINEIEMPKVLIDDFSIHRFDFLKDLKLTGMKYSEGFSEMHNPSYSTTEETILCQITGQVDIIIIPALHRNFVYPYKRPYGPPNFSPVNFFKAEYGRFPEFKKVNRMYVNLEKGDCLYIPAFWWYMTKTDENVHFITVSALFKSHSRLVEDIVHGIEVNNF
jgi:hypothetical protein